MNSEGQTSGQADEAGSSLKPTLLMGHLQTHFEGLYNSHRRRRLIDQDDGNHHEVIAQRSDSRSKSRYEILV